MSWVDRFYSTPFHPHGHPRQEETGVLKSGHSGARRGQTPPDSHSLRAGVDTRGLGQEERGRERPTPVLDPGPQVMLTQMPDTDLGRAWEADGIPTKTETQSDRGQ